MTDRRPVLFWFRRDLRLSDHPGLTAACAAGGPVIPVFVLDPETAAIGAAPRWRLGLSVADLGARLGSGTSVIAAETTRRTCLGLELDPAYVDVIVIRWERFTGGTGRLDGEGLTLAQAREQRRLGPATG